MKLRPVPLYLQVVVAVGCGAALGAVLGERAAVLGELGMLVVRALKALAIPLVLFAIVDAFCRHGLSGRSGGKLALVCVLNASVACGIGLALIHGLRPGERCRAAIAAARGGAIVAPVQAAATPSAVEALSAVVPESLVDPLAQNNIVGVVLLAMLGGAALRQLKGRSEAQAIASLVGGALLALQAMLGWVAKLVPLAVLGLVAQAVGKAGLAAFSQVLPFMAVVLLGLGAHAFGYYLLVVWGIGGKSPLRFLRAGADAILTGFSTNSSVAALPLTLQGLARLGVSDASARMGACIGTNLNNDGATLYEAMAALFIAQALGIELSLGQQLTVMGASLVAGMGVNGIPGGSLVMLPVVLGVVGLPPELIGVAVSFLAPIDWLIARCRTVVCVMADMTVSVLLDAPAPPVAASESGVP